ncbi:hypothetical protein K7432_013452 [Basidiobolus ranarum]|uniref:UBC core domain-containing protein n=1 Tax=Basidiobolus ranarum TaxID=34480 RepID=A0ABR2VQY7_9FUNG
MSTMSDTSDLASHYNRKSPAVKRIMRELAELEKEPSAEFVATPLESNIFEWHFTLRGPAGTPFEEGRYHGRLLLPFEYPFKPPNIMLLTPNGRFEINKKICLSITGYHPEFWQPVWGIRLALLALISFMPTHGEGAIGALDCSDADRKIVAKKSINWECNICGIKMRDVLQEKPEGGENSETQNNNDRKVKEELAKLSFSVQSADQLKQSDAASRQAKADIPPISRPNDATKEASNEAISSPSEDGVHPAPTPTVQPTVQLEEQSSQSVTGSPVNAQPAVPNNRWMLSKGALDVLIILCASILAGLIYRKIDRD